MFIHDFPACPTCKVDILPYVDYRVIESHRWEGDWWCPTCKGLFETRKREVLLGGVVKDPPTELKLRAAPSITARVEPDGTVRIRIGDGQAQTFTIRDLEGLDRALGWLRRGAQVRQEKLRGAHLWVFSRNGIDFDDCQRFLVQHLDESRVLEPYRVGRSPSGRKTQCAACKREIGTGAPAYKATRRPWEFSRVNWRDLRFCAACVEAGGEARQRGPLRIIDGGKGATG